MRVTEFNKAILVTIFWPFVIASGTYIIINTQMEWGLEIE